MFYRAYEKSAEFSSQQMILSSDSTANNARGVNVEQMLSPRRAKKPNRENIPRRWLCTDRYLETEFSVVRRRLTSTLDEQNERNGEEREEREVYLHDHRGIFHNTPARAELLNGTGRVQASRSPGNRNTYRLEHKSADLFFLLVFSFRPQR